MTDVVDGRAALWISGANLEDTRRPRHFAPEQARADLAVMLLRAKDRLSDDFADAPPDRELARGERDRLGHLRDRARPSASACRCGASASSTTSGSSTASPTSPTPRSSAAGTRRRMTFAGIREICKETGAADRGRLQGPGRHPPPEVAVGVDRLRSRRQASQVRSWAEMVSRRSIVGFSASSGTAAAAMSIMSVGVEMGAGRVGRVPLLDHDESATLRGRGEQVDVAARGLAAGQTRRSGRAPRRAPPRGRAGRRTWRSAPRSRPRRSCSDSSSRLAGAAPRDDNAIGRRTRCERVRGSKRAA